MKDSWKQVLSLIKKTRDRCIVWDSSHDEVFVVMSGDEYEKLILGKSDVLDLTEEELLDKINQDIADWQGNQPENSSEECENSESALAEDDRYYFETIE